MARWVPGDNRHAADAIDERPGVLLDWAGRGEVTSEHLPQKAPAELERMAREPRDNLLGPEVWGALEPATRRLGWEPRCNKTSASASRCRHIEPSAGGLHVGTRPRYQRVLLEADLHGLL